VESDTSADVPFWAGSTGLVDDVLGGTFCALPGATKPLAPASSERPYVTEVHPQTGGTGRGGAGYSAAYSDTAR
jgi:hypothetical protein